MVNTSNTIAEILEITSLGANDFQPARRLSPKVASKIPRKSPGRAKMFWMREKTDPVLGSMDSGNARPIRIEKNASIKRMRPARTSRLPLTTLRAIPRESQTNAKAHRDIFISQELEVFA